MVAEAAEGNSGGWWTGEQTGVSCRSMFFCGEQLLVSYLRPSNIDAAQHAWAILKLLVQRLRETWPQVRIIFRGDSGFCRWKMLRWCERHGVDYIVGLAKNTRLLALAAGSMQSAAAQFANRGEKQRLFWLARLRRGQLGSGAAGHS